MKWLIPALIVFGLMIEGCGAGHPNLTTVTVSPATATASSSPQGDVVFTANGTFNNGSTSELTVADGLTWSSSNTAVATVNDNGSATCLSSGTVTISAQAPVNLQITVNNGVNNTSSNVTGTATLNCT